MSIDTALDTPLGDAIGTWLRGAFGRAFPDHVAESAGICAVPTAQEGFGDYQCSGAMSLAKALRISPRQIAQKIVDAAGTDERVERMEIAGPGFINIFLSDVWLARYVERLCTDERLGTPMAGQGKTIVMDYGSPNITKPLHIGHLRSHNIGAALDRMHRFLGYHVIADNHLGDWGTQFGITILGWRNFGDAAALEAHPLEELERVYVKSYARGQTDEAWRNECRKELVRLQAGDPEILAIWRRFVDFSIAELERLYARLGITFDLVRGESHYHDKLQGTIEQLVARGLAVESEGALVVFLEEEKLPPCLVRKSDGGFNYATTDIATVLSRAAEFKPERVVYVTDERQQLHFRQVFAVCRRLGVTLDLQHVWFGLMRLPDATFSTREGNVIKLEVLLDEAEKRALAVVKESNPEMAPDEQQRIARMIGIGAVKYADLSQNPQSVVTFTWEKALALNGNSAPYLQYAHARIASVQDKYAERFPGRRAEDQPIRLEEPAEKRLARQVARFPETILRAAESYKPSVLADYLYELSGAYSSFYQNVPFLKAEEGVRESRVRLCAAVARILKHGLGLLGIEAPSRI